MENFNIWIIKKRLWVLVATLLITVLVLSQLKRLTVVIEMDKIMPQNHPYVVANRVIEETFGNKYTSAIAITSKKNTIFETPILEKVQRITQKIREVHGVIPNSVISLSAPKAKSIVGNASGMNVQPLMGQVPTTEEEMARLKADVAAMPIYSKLLVSEDQTITQIVVQVKNVPKGMAKVANDIQQIADAEKDETVEINVAGPSVYMGLLEKFSGRMGLLFPLALLIIGLIHFEAFRTWQAMLLPLVTALLAVIWALGGLLLASQPMDVFNSTTPILILAIAAGHAVQILKRYYEEYANLKSKNPSMEPKQLNQKAVLTAMTRVGPVMVTAYAIAALSFFSLVIFEIETIRTFGLFTGTGVLSALILELTFIPALRSYLPAPGEKEIKREGHHSHWDTLIEIFYAWVLNKRKKLYWMTFFALITLTVGVLVLRVDNSQRKFFFEHLPVRIQDNYINDHMAGTNTIYVLIEGNSEDAIKRPAVMKGMDNLQQFLEKQEHVGKTLSIANFIKRMNQAMNEDNPQFYAIPSSQDLIAQYLFLYSNSGEPGDFDSYVDTGYRSALIQSFVKTDRTQLISELIKKIQDFSRGQFPSDVTVTVGGGATLGVAINEVMIREKIFNILQILGVVLLISSLVFRSFVAGALILVPLIAVVAVNFGIMGLLGIPLQIATVLISAMAVGIGADYGIYMSFRMREELISGRAEAEALKRAYRSAGKATLYVSSAVAGGFGVLMLSWGFWVHIWLGFLISVAMLVASFTALTLFPALIFTVRPNFIFKPHKSGS